MMQHVDFANVMSYDLHGVWDAEDPIGNTVLAHTNLTEIKSMISVTLYMSYNNWFRCLGSNVEKRSPCWQAKPWVGLLRPFFPTF